MNMDVDLSTVPNKNSLDIDDTSVSDKSVELMPVIRTDPQRGLHRAPTFQVGMPSHIQDSAKQLLLLGDKCKAEKNYPNMIKYYKMAAEMATGMGTGMAVEMASDKGNKESAAAMFQLAWYYDQNKDMENAFKYYKMAVEKGNAQAMFNLAMCYDTIGDHENMVKHYLMAIEKKHLRAVHNLALYYYDQNDMINTLKYGTIGVEMGGAGSMNMMGLYYHKQKDRDNMLKYYMMAIEKQNSSAMCNLAQYYKENNDHANMIKYYKMAADKGHANAMFQLGYYYSEEAPTLENQANMIEYWTMAVKNENINAMFNLGLHFQQQQDFTNMIKYYSMAVDKGDVGAMIELAEHYTEHGKNELSLHYYLMAVAKETKWIPNLEKFADDVKCEPECFNALINILIEHCAAHSVDVGDLLKHIGENKTDDKKTFDPYKIIGACENMINNNYKTDHAIITEICTLRQRCKMLEAEMKKKDDYMTELELMPEGPKYAQAKQSFQATVQSMNIM